MQLEIILQKQFLTDFFDSFDESDEYWLDFQDFIKRRTKNFTLIIDVISDAEYQTLIDENALLKWLDSHAALVEYHSNLQPFLHYQQGSAFKLFLTILDNQTCQTLQQNYGFSYFNPLNIPAEWTVFYSKREDIEQSVSYGEFDNWSKLNAFSHPLHSIVIFDNYILKEKPAYPNPVNQRLEDNLFPILKELLSQAANNKTIDIMIFSEKFHHYASQSNDIQVLHYHITQYIHQHFPQLTYNLSLVRYDKRLHETLPNSVREHDRFILTNYFYIEIPAGFDIFSITNSITNRSSIRFHFIFNAPHSKIVKIALDNIDKYLNGIHNTTSATFYFPHKNNRLFQ